MPRIMKKPKGKRTRRSKRPVKADPYEALRKAQSIMKKRAKEGHEDAAAWLKEYKRLPGVDLTRAEVQVLRDSSLRCVHNQDAVNKLERKGYLREVRVMHSRHLRVSKSGNIALKLRSNVPHLCGHKH